MSCLLKDHERQTPTAPLAYGPYVTTQMSSRTALPFSQKVRIKECVEGPQ